MGNCSSFKRKIPITHRKGSSNSLKRVLLDDLKKQDKNFRRYISRDHLLTTSKEININISSNKKDNNNKSSNSMIPYSRKEKSIIIQFKRNKKLNNNKLIQFKSKENNNNSIIKKFNKSTSSKSKYIHIKNRSSSSRYDTCSINSCINKNYQNSQIINNKNNLKIYLSNKKTKTGSKCKNKNRIPRSTFESNHSYLSSSNVRNCKLKINKIYSTYNEINDENINVINKNIFNIYNNNNININVYQTKNNNINKKNKEIYKCIRTIEGHKEKIVSMIQLSNGLVATGSYDCKIKIWDIENNICIRSINENGFIFSLLEMEPNYILSGTNKNTIQLHNINSTSNINENENIFSFKGHDLWVNCLVKCNSQYFSSGSNDAEIKIWDYNGKSLYRTLKGHDDCVLAMALLKNGKLCSGSADLCIKIWEWNKGNCINTLTGHERWIKCICQLESGYLVSGSDDMIIKIWKENECIKNLAGHTHSVRTLCKISDEVFASGSFDGSIKIWDINSNEAIQTLIGHHSYVISVIRIANGDLISCSNDHSIKIWRKFHS